MNHEEASRKRTKIACEECRKNKRKCDGNKPACSPCQKGGKACDYSLELTSKKRKRFDQDYIHDLEEQVKALTALVTANHLVDENLEGGSESCFGQGQMQELQYDGSCEDAMIPDRPTNVPIAPPDSFRRISFQEKTNPELRSATAMEELGSLMLRMGIEEEGEPSFTISTGSKIMSEPGLRSHKVITPRPTPDSSTTPSVFHDLALRHHLLDCFSRHFNPFHQVFEPDQFSDLARADASSWAPDEQIRNMAAFAVSAHFSDRPDARNIGEECAEYAENLILRCLRYYSSDLVVQALSMLAWRDLILGNDSMAWNFISSATGLALRLGLHVTALNKIDNPSDLATTEAHRRRIRSFWIYFSIDRMLTSILGMNATIPWQRVRVPLYSTLRREPTTDEIAFCRQGQLWHLWDSFMDQIYAFDWPSLTSAGKKALLFRSQQALLSFHQASPPVLHASLPSAPPSVIYYQLAFQSTLILIHRPFLSEPIGTPTLSLALQAGTNAAFAICRILRDVLKHGSLAEFPPHAMNYIVCAAVIHLLNATCGRTGLGRKSKGNLKTCLDALGRIGKRSPFRRNASIRFIQELANKWEVVWALPIEFSSPLTKNSSKGGEGKTPTEQQGGGLAVQGIGGLDMWQDVSEHRLVHPIHYHAAVDQLELENGGPGLPSLFADDEMGSNFVGLEPS